MQRRNSLEANFLLRTLLPQHLDKVLSRSQVVTLGAGAVLQDNTLALNYVYFPRAGIISQMIDMRDGRMCEVGTIGSDGALGVDTLLGNAVQHVRSVVTLSLIALRVPIGHIQIMFSTAPELQQVLVDYLMTAATKAHQLAACGILHELEGRLSRWILQALDHDGETSIMVTQETLAQRLGVHRASMSEACVALSKAGLIDSAHRGSIRVLDRERLRLRACECYGRLRG